MRLELTGRHIDITPATRELVERAIAPVLRKLNDRALSAQVVLTRQKSRVHAEVTLHARGVHFLHAEATGADSARAVSAAAAKVGRQAEKLKGKWNTGKGGPKLGAAMPPEAPARPPKPATAPGPRVIRSRRAVKPMSIEDAMALLGEDGVVVFRNPATNAVTVLFRRADGNLGLVEPVA